MKPPIVLSGCLLLLWTLTAFVSCAEDAAEEGIKVTILSGKIRLNCKEEWKINGNATSRELPYSDEWTGEYTCQGNSETDTAKIYVKFRTCDNCVELDGGSLSSIIVGDVVATIVVGVAVYLIASQARTVPVTSNKKSSDRQHLVPNEARATNEHYQPLKHRGQKDTYDELRR
ncbi:T-cell surface glycoprotein CD3 gamma chain-like [Scomber scombrus]|uniref:T-cell surface glycoprotein CD3 gamma chain-like n=1 Tax=Scomber scombrus TaxID=13677 RepID=UPI002DDBCAC1|nr:T-cell surface glycoprotein CD3 gamma chain-like [Scomber scombrus]